MVSTEVWCCGQRPNCGGEFCLYLHRKRVYSYKFNDRILHSLEFRFIDGGINSFSSKRLASDLCKG